MTVDPIIVAAAIALLTAMGGLLLLVYRSFANGSLHPRSTVPREDYERVVAINEGYASRFAEQTEAVRLLSETVGKLVVRRT